MSNTYPQKTTKTKDKKKTKKQSKLQESRERGPAERKRSHTTLNLSSLSLLSHIRASPIHDVTLLTLCQSAGNEMKYDIKTCTHNQEHVYKMTAIKKITTVIISHMYWEEQVYNMSIVKKIKLSYYFLHVGGP